MLTLHVVRSSVTPSMLPPYSPHASISGTSVGLALLLLLCHPSPAFPQARGPLRVSASNPRYFTDDTGKAVYLAGSHTWANLQDFGKTSPPPAFDYLAYLEWLQAYGHNFFRLWAWEQSRYMNAARTDDIWIAPNVYRRTGPGVALDGQPKFDLNLFNEAYFKRLRDRVMEAERRGIYVSIMLFNGFSIEPVKGEASFNDPWRGHPFNRANNINEVNGDTNDSRGILRFFGLGRFDGGRETHQDIANPVNPYQKAYVRKVIDTVNDLDNVLYEISNESPSGSNPWQYDMINYIRTYEATKPKHHPIGMTVAYPGGSDVDLFDSPADWVSPNNKTHDYLNNPPVASGKKVVIADTDHLCGICADPQWAWKSFSRGMNPVLMDVYSNYYPDLPEVKLDPHDPGFVSLRKQLGYTVAFSRKMNLTAMAPQPDLSSTGYCLANLESETAEYLVYRPASSGAIALDLTASAGPFLIEWFNPTTGALTPGGTVNGCTVASFTPPFIADAVMHLQRAASTRSPVPARCPRSQ